MNLIYMCVFHNQDYIKLLSLLVKSISIRGNVNKETTDILIITSPAFQPIIAKELSEFDLSFKYFILDLHTLMQAGSSKLQIFNYEHINNYEKVLYLDTDVLINSDLNTLFNIDIPGDKLHALGEGVICKVYWGSDFFDFNKYDRNTVAFSSGVFYFMNSEPMKALFQDTNNHIAAHMNNGGHPPACLEQPFLVYNSLIQNKCDIEMMNPYLENNPKEASPEKIIYHFPGGPGEYWRKIDRMLPFWQKMGLGSAPV